MANEVRSIKYNGKVKISFVSKSGRPIKSIERHNQGCRPLFNLITSCMMGRYNDSNRPVYLMIYKKGENFSESNLGTYVLPNLQYLVSTENTYDALTNVGSVKYKFIFPGSLLLDDADVLALYNYSNATSSEGYFNRYVFPKENDLIEINGVKFKIMDAYPDRIEYMILD